MDNAERTVLRRPVGLMLRYSMAPPVVAPVSTAVMHAVGLIHTRIALNMLYCDDHYGFDFTSLLWKRRLSLL